MNIIRVIPAKLSGTVVAPPSKSFSHRAIICAALSGVKSNIFPIMFSEDILATVNGIKEMGADISVCKDILAINRFNPSTHNITIDCYDSGSTLRFLIPIVAVLGVNATFKRSIGLSKRPLTDYLEILSRSGVKYKFSQDFSLSISGKLQPGKFWVSGDISSQYISGLLMALPLLNNDSEIKLSSNLESSKYVDITIDVMKTFGVNVAKTVDGFFIQGNQTYKPTDYVVEGDWSQAAFFMAAGAICGDITVKNLNKNSYQGDKQIFDLLKKFGANIYWDNDDIVVYKSQLTGIDIDALEILDLVPILAVVAAHANGITNIKNIKRLKFKECNRLEAIYQELKCLNVDIKKSDDGLIIKGKGKRVYNGDRVWGHNDHRMVMALSIMANGLSGNLEISGFDSIKKSYPYFFEDYNLVGGKTYVVDVGP